jgi:hypothetical protein
LVASRKLGIIRIVAAAVAGGCGGGHATGDGAATEQRGDGGPELATASPVDAACATSDGHMADSTHGFVDLDVMGRGFERYEGKIVWMLTRRTRSDVVFGVARTTIVDGQLMVHFPDGFERQAYQEVFWFVDADGDGLCDDGAGDHVGYTITNGFNPVADEPYLLMFEDSEFLQGPPVGGESICAVMNQCG